MSSNVSLTVLTFILFTTIFFVSANNDKLINKLCSATFVPQACLDCIGNDTPTNTEVDVLLGLLHCGYDDSLTLDIDLNGAIDSDDFDETTKDALRKCRPYTQEVIQNNGVMIHYVATNMFEPARIALPSLIFGRLSVCDGVLNSTVGINIPPKVFSGILAIETSYKLVDQVLATLT